MLSVAMVVICCGGKGGLWPGGVTGAKYRGYGSSAPSDTTCTRQAD